MASNNINRRGSFLEGAFILTIATAFVKIAGLLFKFPVAYILGDSGMGVYYHAYEIYNFLAVLASMGLPVAVSRVISETLVSDNYAEAEKIYQVSIRLFTIIGIVVAAIMAIFSNQLAFLLEGNSYAGDSIRVLSVTALCAFIMSAQRGYFQGNSTMMPTAVSQVIEAVIKLALGISLALVAVRAEAGDSLASAAAISGVSAGAVCAVIFLFVWKKKTDRKEKELISDQPVRSGRRIIWELFRIAVPVSLGQSVISFVALIDNYVIMHILQEGILIGRLVLLNGYQMLDTDANALYGVFSNAKSVFNLPSAFIVPFTISILPALTAAFTRGDQEGVGKNMTNCFKYALMLAAPAGIGLFVMAKPIYGILYPKSDLTEGAPMLAAFGIAVILYAVVSITGAMLQAFGKATRPLISMLAGGAVKCALTTGLLLVPDLKIKGAPIATCVCYTVMILMNLFFLRSYIKGCVKSILGSTAKTLGAALIMGGAAYLLFIPLNGWMGLKLGGAVAILAAGLIYIALIFAFRIVTLNELKNIRSKG